MGSGLCFYPWAGFCYRFVIDDSYGDGLTVTSGTWQIKYGSIASYTSPSNGNYFSRETFDLCDPRGTLAPTFPPTGSPSKSPTTTRAPSRGPSRTPSQSPSRSPSVAPSLSPSLAPSTAQPTAQPTLVPTFAMTCLENKEGYSTTAPVSIVSTSSVNDCVARCQTGCQFVVFYNIPGFTQCLVFNVPASAVNDVVGAYYCSSTTEAPTTAAPTPPGSLPPTKSPSVSPTRRPTHTPSREPSQQPSPQPSRSPTTASPSLSPTRHPTFAPTLLRKLQLSETFQFLRQMWEWNC